MGDGSVSISQDVVFLGDLFTLKATLLARSIEPRQVCSIHDRGHNIIGGELGGTMTWFRPLDGAYTLIKRITVGWKTFCT